MSQLDKQKIRARCVAGEASAAPPRCVAGGASAGALSSCTLQYSV